MWAAFPLPFLRPSLSIQVPQTTTGAVLPCRDFSRLGNPHLEIPKLAFCVVGCDFRHLPLSCGCLIFEYHMLACTQNTSIENPVRFNSFRTWGRVPQLWLSFRQFSFHPHTQIFIPGQRDTYELPVTAALAPLEQRHATLPVWFPFRISRRMIGCNPLFTGSPSPPYIYGCGDTFPYCLLKAVFW